MKRKGLIKVSAIVGFILLIPMAAMLFTDEVNWSLLDFLVAGIILFGFGVLLLIVHEKIKSKNHRIILFLLLITILLLLWAELAVGIFGTPFAGN